MGLSDSIGPIAYKQQDNGSFVPGIGRGSAISPDTAKLIESEIKRFITEAHEKALEILKKKKKTGSNSRKRSSNMKRSRAMRLKSFSKMIPSLSVPTYQAAEGRCGGCADDAQAEAQPIGGTSTAKDISD